MATYAEMFDIASKNLIRDKVTVAVAMQAEVIRKELDTVPNHTNRMLWAKEALIAPHEMASKIMWAIVVQNATYTSAQIIGASDAATLTAVQRHVKHRAHLGLQLQALAHARIHAAVVVAHRQRGHGVAFFKQHVGGVAELGHEVLACQMSMKKAGAVFTAAGFAA